MKLPVKNVLFIVIALSTLAICCFNSNSTGMELIVTKANLARTAAHSSTKFGFVYLEDVTLKRLFCLYVVDVSKINKGNIQFINNESDYIAAQHDGEIKKINNLKEKAKYLVEILKKNPFTPKISTTSAKIIVSQLRSLLKNTDVPTVNEEYVYPKDWPDISSNTIIGKAINI